MALLEVKGLTKYFGGLAALSELDFEILEGEILGLIGPNGAGKTTLYNCVSGLFKPTRGKIFYKGEDITGLPIYKTAQKGLVRTFQLTELFKEMTTFENVVVAHHLHSREGIWQGMLDVNEARKDRREIQRSALDILQFLGLADMKDELAGNLPHGYQRALGVGLGLAASPEVLLLDEPVTGMNPLEMTTFMEILKRIREERGITLMVVEHNMKAVLGICDRVFVINFGKKIAEGSPSEIVRNKEVIEAYLGVEKEG